MKERRVTIETAEHVTTEIGQRLLDFIKEKGITEAGFARLLGLPKSTVNGILHGVTQIPQKDFIDKVADVTGIPYYELMAMVYPRLNSELDLLLGDISVEKRRERLNVARTGDLKLSPEAKARLMSKYKSK